MPLSHRSIRNALLGLLLVPAGAFAQLTISSNPHYFNYNGVPTALVGVSGEYIPHISDTNPFTWKDKRCRYDDGTTAGAGEFKRCIDDFAAKGLNKIRMWVGLTFSPGFEEKGSPFTYEQPFFWNGSRWRLDRYEPNFFTRVKEVIAYAASKDPDMIVEVTLFAHSGNYANGPWSSTRNLYYDSGGVQHVGVGFTSQSYVMSFDPGYNAADAEPDANTTNEEARRLQVAYVEKTVRELNAYTNFYWEIANEPDFNTVTLPTDIQAMIDWHNYIAQKIIAAEAPLPNKHLIAGNFITQAAWEKVRGTAANPSKLDTNIKIVNGHYVDISPKTTSGGTTPTRYGAIKVVRTYNRTAAPIAGRLFGFNETQISHDPNSRMSSRAEAWEFMLNEGGLYDNLNYAWNQPVPTGGTCDAACRSTCCKYCNNSALVRTDLGSVNAFLKGLNLVNMRRQTGSTPTWVTSGVPAYGSSDISIGANTYWAAMQSTGEQYALYLHHSTLSTDAGAKWYIPKAGTYTRSLTFDLTGSAIGQNFKVEWFVPPPCTLPGTSQTVTTQPLVWNGSPVTLGSPVYNYDLAVRITKCPGSTPCA